MSASQPELHECPPDKDLEDGCRGTDWTPPRINAVLKLFAQVTNMPNAWRDVAYSMRSCTGIKPNEKDVEKILGDTKEQFYVSLTIAVVLRIATTASVLLCRPRR